MYAAVGSQTHEVELLAVILGVLVSGLHLWVGDDGAVSAGAVDLHEVLVYDAAGADIEVSYLRVAHLAVRQTNVLA